MCFLAPLREAPFAYRRAAACFLEIRTSCCAKLLVKGKGTNSRFCNFFLGGTRFKEEIRHSKCFTFLVALHPQRTALTGSESTLKTQPSIKRTPVCPEKTICSKRVCALQGSTSSEETKFS